MKTARQIIRTFNNCGTGAGGFKSGNKCQLGGGGGGGGGKSSKEQAVKAATMAGFKGGAAAAKALKHHGVSPNPTQKDVETLHKAYIKSYDSQGKTSTTTFHKNKYKLTQALHAVQTGKLVKPKRFGPSEISDFSG